jgi:hypothetical protein
MGWRVGDSFRALDTADVRQAGITPGAGGEISSILGAKISFYLERGGPGSGFIEAHSDMGSFGANFARDKAKETARRTFRDARIFPQTFPNDFLKKKK